MKVLRLELEGFGPYRAAQTIDFGVFDDDIFVITGKTGAGKSTILDAIVFALYDKVPRYDGTEKSVRSDFCGVDDPTSVTLEFDSGGQRYRVWRSPEYQRPKKRGEGTTTKKSEAMLYRWSDGDWEALEVRPVEVGKRISDIMRLTADQFLQVILLAQGRFQEFLQADTKERLAVLRSLFGTARFEAIQSHVREVAKERSRAVEAADAGLSELVARAAAEAGIDAPTPPEWEAWLSDTATALAEAAVQAAEVRLEAGKAAHVAAEAFANAKTVLDKRAKLADAQQTVMALEARADQHQADRERLDGATRAKPVAAPRRALERAIAELETAVGARDTAVESALVPAIAEVAWPTSLGALAEASEEVLAGRVSELASEIGALSTALKQELALPRLREDVEQSGTAVQVARDERDAAQKALDELPSLAKNLREARDQAGQKAARVDDLEQALKRAEEASEAHEQVLLLTASLQAATKERDQALAAHAAATEAYNDLVQRRLRSQAAHLAADLTDGEPCPVCGASEHPSPAQPSDDHVTDAQVEAARDVESDAGDALKGAKDGVAGIEANLAVARAVARAGAGDGDAEAALARVHKALEQLESARDAAQEKSRLDEELAGLEQREVTLKHALAAKVEALEAAQAARTQANSAVEAASTQVVQARADYESVGARARDLERAKRLVVAVAQAAGQVTDAQAAVAHARQALDEALEESGFASVEKAHDALLPGPELAALQSAVTRYESDLAGARAVVASLSAEPLPHQAAELVPGDVEVLGASAAETAQARDTAIAGETAAVTQSKRFATLREEYAGKAKASQQAREARDVALTLADSLDGSPPNERRMRLESFVLASKLERIVAAANARLSVMSSGQYRLEHDDDRQYRNTQTGLGLRIADSHTGRSRSTRSLSGGETFLASLALALGLAETVTAEAGGIQLSTLFIDEGFGSLDADTLEMAMATLDELRSGGRTIGLISHVEAMKEQIPAKLEIEKLADGSSRVVVAGVDA